MGKRLEMCEGIISQTRPVGGKMW